MEKTFWGVAFILLDTGFFYLCLLATLRKANGFSWIFQDMSDMTKGTTGLTVSRQPRLFHARQTWRGGGLRPFVYNSSTIWWKRRLYGRVVINLDSPKSSRLFKRHSRRSRFKQGRMYKYQNSKVPYRIWGKWRYRNRLFCWSITYGLINQCANYLID